MFENQTDSDDDFEGYFLKPVNEYNIVDKIQEANKELFSTPQPPSPSSSGLQRKVTFRAVLEDYEPHEQYAVQIEVGSVNTEEGFIISDVEQPENFGFVDEASESVKQVSEPEVESENEIEEICEEVIDLDIESTHVEITENLKLNIHPGNSNQVENENIQKPETSERRNSGDDSSRTSDDDLSVIVASYIADDPKRKFHDDNEKITIKAKCKRTFSLKSRKKGKKQDDDDVPKINLNYKTCCEYKNATNEQLPKYTGYLSTYGLSKEQWERREKLLDKKKKHAVKKTVQASEEEIKKMDDNERAFTNWLRNKMRCPINKTKNMFDFKPKKQKNKTK